MTEEARPTPAGDGPPVAGEAFEPGREPRRERRRERRKERRKERRLARHLRHARTIWRDPRSAGGLLREGLIGIWRARGAGFYGFGYLVTFVILEVRLVTGEYQASASLMSFLSDQLLEYLLRLGFMSFVNVFLAFLWPLMVLERLGGWGLLVLAAGYFAFERGLRRRIEALVPELARRPPEESAESAGDSR